MSALVVLAVGLAAGIGARRSGRVSGGSHEVLNVWVLDVALPALVFRAMHDMVFPADVAVVVAAPYLLFAVSAMIFLVVGRLLRLGREVTGALIATAALANTSFVGIPMLTAFFGEADIPVAVLVDQLGSFLLLMTVISLTVVLAARPARARPVTVPLAAAVAVAPAGVATGGVATGGIATGGVATGPPGSTSPGDPPAESASGMGLGRTVRSILLAPAMLALLAGLALRPVELPGELDQALVTLGATLTPVALFAVGLQLHVDALRVWWRHVALGLAVKLVAAPALVMGLYLGVGAVGSRAVDVALFEIAMPPMVAGSIMATRAGLATPLPSLLVGVGVPVSLLTLPVWSWLLQR